MKSDPRNHMNEHKETENDQLEMANEKWKIFTRSRHFAIADAKEFSPPLPLSPPVLYRT
jgi:hypothetical protein